MPYTGDFPDPSVWFENGTYHAYATSTGGRYIPMLTSTDLTTWTARPAYEPDPYPDEVIDPAFNDALVAPASWARPLGYNHPHVSTDVWAPGVVKIAETYLAFYSTLAAYGDPELRTPNRYCVSVATSASPLGPFVDNTNAPLVCDDDPGGSIDPDVFVDPASGTAHLLWKSEGTRDAVPPRLWSRELDASGLAFAPGSAAVQLLEAEQRWEFQIIENPSMVFHDGRYLLFYSAHYWQSRNYSIAVAECAGPLGPCARQREGEWPLLLSRGDQNGPGGADAFVHEDGSLRLLYHAWNAPYTRYPSFPACATTDTCAARGQRRLHTTVVDSDDDGLLTIGGPVELTVGYSTEDYALLADAAAAAEVTPEELQEFGIYAMVFLTKLAGNDQRHEVVRPRPDVTGEVQVTTTFSAANRVILDWAANHFVLSDVETLKAGVTLQVFLRWLSQQPPAD